MSGYRPSYLTDVTLSRKRFDRDYRSVYLGPDATAPERFRNQKLGVVELVHRPAVSYWRFEAGGRAYPTARHAAEALTVTVIEGPAQCAAFDAERMKRQAS